MPATHSVAGYLLLLNDGNLPHPTSSVTGNAITPDDKYLFVCDIGNREAQGKIAAIVALSASGMKAFICFFNDKIPMTQFTPLPYPHTLQKACSKFTSIKL